MREFFINWAERLLLVFMVVAAVGVAVAAFAVMGQPAPKGGLLPGLAVLIMGEIYVTLMAGLMFVAFGIYRNGQETNRLLSARQ